MFGKRLVPQLYADDLVSGHSFNGPPNTITVELFQAFAKMTGDAHPIHYDEDYARNTRFRKPLAHGLLLMGMTALGATPASEAFEDSMVALHSQACRFLAPVFVGDVVSSRFKLRSVEKRPSGKTALVTFDVELVNQSEATILEGSHAYIVRYRNAG